MYVKQLEEVHRNGIMKYSSFLVLFIISLLALACEKKVETPHLDFKPEQVTYVKYNIKNCISEKSLLIFYNQTLPLNQEVLTYEISSDTSFVQDITINHPIHINLYDGKGHAILLAVPNDTLIVNIDYSGNNSLIDYINFQGLTGAISKYLTFDRYRHKYAPKENQSIANFNSMIDSLYEHELEEIEAVEKKGTLPNWFVDLEKINIKYEAETVKARQYNQRYAFYKQFFPREPDFPKNIDFSNMKYYWLDNATRTLVSVKPDKYDSLIQPQTITLQISLDVVQDNVDLLKGQLSEDALSYFVASRISMLYSKKKLLRLSSAEFSDRKQEIDDLINTNKSLMTDTLVYSYLIKERDKAYKAVKDRNLLGDNEKAPSFYLSNPNGEYKRLSDYNGKVMLLNFWNLSCSPCINNIPEYNRLVEKFDEEEFVLINICTDTFFERWKQLINKQNFLGEQLICKGNWGEKLRAEYNIYGVPHYTIIGRDGRVIKNKVKDSLEDIITENL
jgi:peroxiredoxin